MNRDQNWFDDVFGYAASIVADFRERVLFEGWDGRKSGPNHENVTNIYSANFHAIEPTQDQDKGLQPQQPQKEIGIDR